MRFSLDNPYNTPNDINSHGKIRKLSVTCSLSDPKDYKGGELEFNFNNQINVLEQQFDTLRELSKLTDVSFLGAVNAQEKKQLKGLKNLEKRLLKANKIKHKSHLDRITTIQDDLFPNNSLQERSVNFAQFYCQFGDQFIKILKDNIHPLNNKFSIIEL